MTMTNRQILFVSRPEKTPVESNFRLHEGTIDEPADGQVLIRSHYLSVDPYLRGLMNENAGYFTPARLGEVMQAGAVGKVVASRNPNFKEGDAVVGHWGWQEYALSDGSDLMPFDSSLGPLSTALGVLGMPGMTAYFGLLEIGRPKPDETVFVSGAAGAVGSLVGQIARIQGCRVAGSAGSDEKVAYLLDELGFDAAFNYRDVSDYAAVVRVACPQGVDVYFDNTGGPVTDAVFPQLNTGARVVVCGQIDQYNDPERAQGPRLLWHLIMKQARAEGFLVFQFLDRYPEGQRQMAAWISEGRISWRETVVDGIENTPKAFIGLFIGANVGKQLVRLVNE